jgi:hypothetical protein
MEKSTVVRACVCVCVCHMPPPHPPFAVGPAGQYFVRFQDGRNCWAAPHPHFATAAAAAAVARVAFGGGGGGGGFAVLYARDSDGNGPAPRWADVPPALAERLEAEAEAAAGPGRRRRAAEVGLGPSGEWFLAYDDGDWAVRGAVPALSRLLQIVGPVSRLGPRLGPDSDHRAVPALSRLFQLRVLSRCGCLSPVARLVACHKRDLVSRCGCRADNL